MTNVIRIQGIGPSYAEKLVANGIKTLEKLLEAGSSKNGRTQIAEKTGIAQGRLIEVGVEYPSFVPQFPTRQKVPILIRLIPGQRRKQIIPFNRISDLVPVSIFGQGSSRHLGPPHFSVRARYLSTGIITKPSYMILKLKLDEPRCRSMNTMGISLTLKPESRLL